MENKTRANLEAWRHVTWKLLERADERELKLIYHFVDALIGNGDPTGGKA